MSSYPGQIAARGAGVRPALAVNVTPPRDMPFSLTASFRQPSAPVEFTTETPGTSSATRPEPASTTGSLLEKKSPSSSAVVREEFSSPETTFRSTTLSASTTKDEKTPVIHPAIAVRKDIPRRAAKDDQVLPHVEAVLPTGRMQPPVPPDRLTPSLFRQDSRISDRQSSSLAASKKEDAVPSQGGTLPPGFEAAVPVVRLEPSRRFDSVQQGTAPTFGSPESGSISGEPLPATRLRERTNRTPSRPPDVKVTIGQVNVQVETVKTAPLQPKAHSAPSDPFASLAFARRGWRTVF
jgi:hypothetical protein